MLKALNERPVLASRQSPAYPHMNTRTSEHAPRLFQREGLAPGAIVSLDEASQRHVAALRLQRGDRVILFSGDGRECPAELIDIGRRGATAKVLEVRAVDRESPLAITLVQGICAADRMDWIIQKATELGVHAIQPVICQRTVIRLSNERQERREQHWQAVAIAACEQSGRNRVPEIRASLKLDALVAALPAVDRKIVLSPYGERRLSELREPDQPPIKSIMIAIGPEGGLIGPEVDLLNSRGFATVRIGPRVLRTETAPLAAIAALQVLWGDC